MKKRLVCGDIHGHFDTFLEIYNEEFKSNGYDILKGKRLKNFIKKYN